LADGTYTLSRGILLNLPFGERVDLVGNRGAPSSCVLEWVSANVDGLTVVDGHSFGMIDGLTIRKRAKAEWPDNATAILALRDATLHVGSSVLVDNWYYGIAAREHSHIECRGARVSNAGDVGIWAYRQSQVMADEASSSGAGDTRNGLGFGFQAEFGSLLLARRAQATDCLRAGFAALSQSRALLPECISTRNRGSGFLAQEGGNIDAPRAQAVRNDGYGVEILSGGQITRLGLNEYNRHGARKP
jgi:hypothetical protein